MSIYSSSHLNISRGIRHIIPGLHRASLSRILGLENLVHFLQGPPLRLDEEELNDAEFEKIPKSKEYVAEALS